MTISHTVTGSGPTVLLVHAGVADARMWTRQVADLRADHEVITLDLRGYGQTPLDPGAAYADADDVLAVLDQLDRPQVMAVGASYGAGVLLQTASAAPDRFSRMLLLSPPDEATDATPDLTAFAREENRLLASGDVAGATELNVETWLGPDADRATRELLRQMQRHAFERQLSAGDDVTRSELVVRPELITVPVRVVSGRHDLVFFRRSAVRLAEALPRAEHVELAWAGHLPTLERPDEGVALVRSGLSG